MIEMLEQDHPAVAAAGAAQRTRARGVVATPRKRSRPARATEDSARASAVHRGGVLP